LTLFITLDVTLTLTLTLQGARLARHLLVLALLERARRPAQGFAAVAAAAAEPAASGERRGMGATAALLARRA